MHKRAACDSFMGDQMSENYDYLPSEALIDRFNLISNSSENCLVKGDGGRVCVIGGTRNYSGAPYFASISALLSGADLVYVICTKDASIPIKSYDPNLIVMSYLDMDFDEFPSKFAKLISKFHSVVIGPGLSRESHLLKNVETVVEMCRSHKTPLVVDADGIFFLSNKTDLFLQYPGRLIITPNHREINRLILDIEQLDLFLGQLCGFEICLLLKGATDRIFVKTPTANMYMKITNIGSMRRCGGQGDMLAGILGAFLCNNEVPMEVICYTAAFLTRKANEYAFEKNNRCMLVTNMIEVLPTVLRGFIFRDMSELDSE